MRVPQARARIQYSNPLLLVCSGESVGPLTEDFGRGEGRRMGGRARVVDVHTDDLAQVVHAHRLLYNLGRGAERGGLAKQNHEDAPSCSTLGLRSGFRLGA